MHAARPPCPLDEGLPLLGVGDPLQVGRLPQLVLEGFGHHHAGQPFELLRPQVGQGWALVRDPLRLARHKAWRAHDSKHFPFV